jgi:5-methylcytosine-specific restriction endonuclease McrA
MLNIVGYSMTKIEKLIREISNGNEEYFYNSRTWRNKRKQILKRDNYECQLCKAKGKFAKGEVVHHVKHLKDRPNLALDDKNLITVCNTCHELEHPDRFRKQENKKKPITKERW